MSNLLAIYSSPRGEASVSRKLTGMFISGWREANPQGAVVDRDLTQTHLPFVDLPWIVGSHTPDDLHSPAMRDALRVSNQLIPELFAADHIVLGTSLYNHSIPAILKAYIDHVVRVGVTVSPSYEGLLKGKKLTVILASAGVYTPGSPNESYNVASSYLKQIFAFIGITDVRIVLAGGTVAVDRQEATMEELVAHFQAGISAAVKETGSK